MGGDMQGKQTQDFFLTARNSIGVWFIGWSFYAAVLGSWAVFSIPSYAYTAGEFSGSALHGHLPAIAFGSAIMDTG